MNVFSKKYRNPVDIGKKLNLVFKNDALFEKISNDDNYDFLIASIIQYYIYSNDSKTDYSYEQLYQKLFEISDKFDFSKYLENPIIAHAFNGYNKKNVERKGLGVDNFFDKELKADLELLEKYLGCSVYNSSQQNTKSETYISTPGRLIVNYAMKGSPERIIMGILHQDYYDALEIKLGESKKEYFTRVLKHKLEKINLSTEEVFLLSESVERVLEKLCTKRPIIALFPAIINGKILDASVIRNENEKKPILNYITNYYDAFADGSFDFFNGGEYSSNVANLVISDVVPSRHIGLVEIPDYFEIIQKKMQLLNLKTYPINNLFFDDLQFSELEPCNIGGTGEKHFFSRMHRKYIYKPAVLRGTNIPNISRGIVQECAYEVQKMVDPDACIFCKYINNDEVQGSVQEFKTINESKTLELSNIDAFVFTPNLLNQFLREFIIDFLLFNYDAHGENFIICDEKGTQKIYGVDKEQSFKYMFACPNGPHINYHPNDVYGEDEPVYNTIFKKYIRNEIDLDFSVLEKYIKRVENISSQYYQSVFTSYVKSASIEFGFDEQSAFERIMDRKENLRKYINDFKVKLQNVRREFIAKQNSQNFDQEEIQNIKSR